MGVAGFGVHVCEGCGSVYTTLGPYWDCQERCSKRILMEKELELDLIRWYTESPSNR